MRELTHSFSRFSWVMALFGLRQLSSLLASPNEDGFDDMEAGPRPHDPARAFDAVSRTVEGELGEALHQVFRSGERMLRTMVDAVFGWGLGDGGAGCGRLGLEDRNPAWFPGPTSAAGWDSSEPSPMDWVGGWGPMPEDHATSSSHAEPDPFMGAFDQALTQESPAETTGGWGPMPPIPGAEDQHDWQAGHPKGPLAP